MHFYQSKNITSLKIWDNCTTLQILCWLNLLPLRLFLSTKQVKLQPETGFIEAQVSLSSTHHYCRSQRRRWVPPASCRDSAPWSPNRSCRWGWALPPAGRRRSRREKGTQERGEKVETVSQLNSLIVQKSTTKCPCVSCHSGWLCINKPRTDWKLQRCPKAESLG